MKKRKTNIYGFIEKEKETNTQKNSKLDKYLHYIFK